ncbi:MAG TPA: DUF2892 domain-containing protein [Polaromonas sp.]|uniref:YgaP family membrane protein n=1 Tax=Polaromonas sp. TaxID=1869339 RepID=UPI002D2DF886|nr:DUF2892 domain-containing protein [Polaromonas sp.]HYW55386.1 DUF2892 domain-containing protein [Polaromonas sp.]
MIYMKRNLPGWERVLRLGGGMTLACATLLLLPMGWLFWAGLATALSLGLTGLVGFCPACAMVGRKPVGAS